MTENDDIEMKKAVRTSKAIENGGSVIAIGLIFMAVSLADGLAQVLMLIIGGVFVWALLNGISSTKEYDHYGIFYNGIKKDQDTKNLEENSD